MFAKKILLSIFACLTFVIFGAAGECSENQFTCYNGNCIALAKQCDGKNDCEDNSDESEYSCLKTEDQVEKFFKKLQGSCQPYEMECNGTDSVKCIEMDQMCDGVADCIDNSDETKELCYGQNCPEFAFKCHYGACIEPNVVCNHVADCVDGSDENPEVCIERERELQLWRAERECFLDDTCIENAEGKVEGVTDDIDPKKKKEEKENTWIAVPFGESPEDFNNCTLPSTSSLQAIDYMTKAMYPPGSGVVSKSIVTFRCPYQQALIGMEHNTCLNGKWLVKLPQCELRCLAQEATLGISTTHSCMYENHHVDCMQPARPGTEVQYNCAPYYKSSERGCKMIQCDTNGKWSAEARSCTPICGTKDVSKQVERPWLVTIYELVLDKYNYKCNGFVVSPKLVALKADCVQTIEGENRPEFDRLSYRIVDGKQSSKNLIEYETHSLRLHNIADALFSKKIEGRESDQLALLKIVDYFQFYHDFKPICVPLTKAEDVIKRLHTIAKQDQFNEIEENYNGNNYTFLSNTVYKISDMPNNTQFSSITDEIEKSLFTF